MITSATRLAAVIGSPVTHSLSPALHNAVFAASELDWRFVAFDVAPGRAADAIAAMPVLGIRGFAVTMPHKHDVARAVDEVDAAASALDSVNTVALRDDGSTFGTSTDGAGFVNSLVASEVALADARVVVLGAGAASRSIVDALGRSDVADIVIVNRTTEAARATASLAAQARVAGADQIATASILVNTTPIGMGSDELPLDTDLLHDGLTVADIVYHPLDTGLLRAARASGASTVDGIGMLVHQAILQQALWTGETPEATLMRAAAEAELARRSR